jgi:amidase
VRSGELSAVDVVRAHLAHIDAVDARIGAFRVVRGEAALPRRRRRRGARPGSPCRCRRARSRSRTTSPSRARSAPTARRPAASVPRPRPSVVARLRKAGAIVVGITRVPELCLYGATDGPGSVSRNPWGHRPVAGRAAQAGVLRRSPPARCRWRTATTAWLAAPPGGRLRAGHAEARARRRPGRDRCRQLVGHGRERRPGDDGGRSRRRPRRAGGGGAGAPGRSRGRPLRIALSTRSPVPGVRADAATRAAVDGVVALLTAAGHHVVRGTRRSPPVPPPGAGPLDGRRRDDAEHLGIDRARCSRAAARTPDRAAGPAGGPGPAATAERFRAAHGRLLRRRRRAAQPGDHRPPCRPRPWHERSFLANIDGQRPVGALDRRWNLAGLPALVAPGRLRPTGCPWPSSSSAPRGRRTTTLAGRRAGTPQPWRRYAPVFDPTAPGARVPA